MWFRVDDKFHEHRKARRAGVEAIGLWALAGSWCGDNLTDGFIPAVVLTRWIPRPGKVAARLVDAGLWEAAERDGESGYAFHGWDEHQPSAAEVLASRAVKHEVKVRAGQVGGIASGVTRRKQTRSRSEADVKQMLEAEAKQNEAGASVLLEANAKQNEAPTRPDPTRPEISGSVGKEPLPPRQREPQSATGAWAETEAHRTWEDELKVELDRFYGCDYPWSWVTRTIEMTIGSREVKNPVAYVMTAVANDRARFGPTNIPKTRLAHLAIGDLPA